MEQAIKKNGLSATALKYLGCAFMLIDHTGLLLFPYQPWLRAVGRLAFPIFAYMIANGYRHTRQPRNYLLRLLAFAVVFQWPYAQIVSATRLSIFTTLALGLASLLCDGWLWARLHSRKLSFALSLLCGALLCWSGELLRVDYGWYGVAMVYTAGLCFGSYRLLTLVWMILTLAETWPLSWSGVSMQIYALLSLPLIFMYNNKPGNGRRWFFYLFYCGHLLALYGIKLLCS